jgi:hypothetical protein
MKHLFTLGAFFMALQLFGQKQIVWFDVGLKAQYGAAGFYNSAIGNSDLFDYKVGNGLGYGGRLGINFAYSGLSLEVMKSKANQTFDRTGSTVIDMVEWNSLDLYALFRHSKNLGYFEIGPKMTLLNKATTTLEGVTAEKTEDFSKNILGGVIGFGANIMGNDGRFSGILGLRFEYGFTDLVADNGATTNAPVYQPVYTEGYKKSNIAFAGVVFELNWGIGYFGKAQCGARSKFIMF